VALTILGDVYYKEYFQFLFDRTNEVQPFTLRAQEMVGKSVEDIIRVSFYPEWSIESTDRHGAGTPSFINIRPLPYCWLHIQEAEDQRFDAGEWHDFELLIENNGNCAVEVTVTLDMPEGFEFSLPLMKLQIKEKGVGTFPIQIKQTSSGSKEGNLKVSVSSDIPGQYNHDQIEVKYQTVGKFQQFMSSALVIAFILIGLATFITAFIMIFRRVKQKKRSYQ
jgi:hypothetical protein